MSKIRKTAAPVTKTRGNWPGVMRKAWANRLPIVDAVHEPKRTAPNKGKSAYADMIDHILSVAPGMRAVDCPDKIAARSVVHAIARHLKADGLYDKLRPSSRKDGDSIKVWIVKKEDV